MVIENISYELLDNLSCIVTLVVFGLVVGVSIMILLKLLKKDRVGLFVFGFIMGAVVIPYISYYIDSYIKAAKQELYNHYFIYHKLDNTVIAVHDSEYIALNLVDRSILSSNYSSYVVYTECKDKDVYRTSAILEYTFGSLTLRSVYVEKGIAFCNDEKAKN